MQEFSRCDSCGARLDDIKVEMPVYCIPCIEGMARLNMSPARYRKYRAKSLS